MLPPSIMAGHFFRRDADLVREVHCEGELIWQRPEPPAMVACRRSASHMKKPDGRAFSFVPAVNGFGGGREVNPNPLFPEIFGRLYGQRDHAIVARADDQPVGSLFEY